MIYVTQLVYLHPGGEAAFLAFEDAVLPLLPKYRGELVLRLRPEATALVGGSSELPYEVHVVRFESRDDLAAYAADEVRQQHLHWKDASVRTTLSITGEA